MGRVADWLFGAVDTAGSSPAVSAAAGTVALARSRHSGAMANTPFTFGPPLAPVAGVGEWAGLDRDFAMSLPTISRAQALIVSAVSALPLRLWSVDESRVPIVEQQIPPYGWMTRPDPDRTRQWLLAWTVDDLLFYEQAHWLITNRYATTYPSAFRRICPGCLEVRTDGTVWVDDPPGTPRREVPAADIVEFLSPLPGILTTGWRAISIAAQLDAAADRFAGTEVPAGVLEEQDSSEDMSADELAQLAENFSRARLGNVTAATNKHVRYREVPYDASKMQLVEARTYQALELARLGNIPPYLVGAPAGTGMTYQNGQQARQDLIDFGALPYIGCIEQTLSAQNVTPRGLAVRLDQNAWLRTQLTDGAQPNDMQLADPTTDPGAAPTTSTSEVPG